MLLRTRRLSSEPPDIAEAAGILQAGGLVGIPTETVYGLAANGLDPDAVAKIFTAKDRPSWDPLILHVSDREMLLQIVDGVSPAAQLLMDAFWPGPLTLLLPRTRAIPSAVTAGRQLAGVRMPAHAVALQVIRATGHPLAAPSANRFGHISPTSAAHVLADLDGRIDAVVDAGPCSIGVESTVLDPSGPRLMIYRQGGVQAAEIEQITGCPVDLYAPPVQQSAPESLPSPGVGMRHYAPRARVTLVDSQEQLWRAAELSDPFTTGVLLPQDWKLPEFRGTVVRWADWDDTAALARELYGALRAIDQPGIKTVLVPMPTESTARDRNGLLGAIRDRLLKAAR